MERLERRRSRVPNFKLGKFGSRSSKKNKSKFEVNEDGQKQKNVCHLC